MKTLENAMLYECDREWNPSCCREIYDLLYNQIIFETSQNPDPSLAFYSHFYCIPSCILYFLPTSQPFLSNYFLETDSFIRLYDCITNKSHYVIQARLCFIAVDWLQNVSPTIIYKIC